MFHADYDMHTRNFHDEVLRARFKRQELYGTITRYDGSSWGCLLEALARSLELLILVYKNRPLIFGVVQFDSKLSQFLDTQALLELAGLIPATVLTNIPHQLLATAAHVFLELDHLLSVAPNVSTNCRSSSSYL